ncbi:FecR family protein [Sphingomonas oryzagri]|uniref:FecR domain-containing protein n=1 Tax=Sphingomonas oryzagri TaxID=3042314 RepID=A0ABT6N0T1_9SPHN|nr:FecR domain-containing protein [Sphingomonas oryzagri]MDH7638802.1 FecR domain-containing protein [Sphingomonas oryzagri]
MINDLACQWAARIERGLDDAERTSLEEWIYADRRHRGALLRAQAALSLLDRGRALPPAEEQPDEAGPAPGRRRFLQFGGGAIAAAIAGGVGLRMWPKGTPISTGVGEIRRMPLGDGSVAVVNSSSRLRVAFTRNARDIELAEGEAWFEVAHNRARPFTVHAGPVRVQAVGTAFDVRRRDGGSDVTVTEGTVKLWSTASGAEPVFVRAGQRAVMTDEAGVVISSLAPATSDQSLAWREGRIVLDDMTLAAAAAEFNRYHAEQLVIDPALADKQVVGWFRTDDLDGFATASAAMVGGRVVRDRNVIRIVP